ncbi:MAG TPA: tetratricopeptide repeat protein, partial [Candidatus Krumholzibacteria bacterium]|nr:tetratricopeptide repeat protein [Candidatus Krumholzibacteria bacterium]
MSFWTRLLRGASGDHYHRGIRLFNEGNYDEAARVLEDLVDHRRANPFSQLGAFYAAEAHSKLGLAHFHRGELDRARHHFAVALTENPRYPDLSYYLGAVEHRAGNHAAAIDHLTRAVELNPDYAEASCTLGLALYDAGFFEQAAEAFGRALELVRKHPHPLSNVLIDQLDARAFDLPALQELREVVADNSSFHATLREATNAFNVGDYDRAVELFGAAVESYPGYADLHARLALARMEADDVGGAIESLQRALAINPAYAEARYYLGVALFRASHYAQSAAELERAASANPTYADVHCQAGLTRLALGDFGGARVSLEKSLEIAPGYAKAHYLNGLARYALGDTTGASESLDRALGLKPDLFAVRMERGLYALRDRRWSDAAQEFEAVLAAAPRHADARCLLGTALAAMGHNDA